MKHIRRARGDDGTTSLIGGVRVWKDDVRVELCGTVDELSSFLGLAKSVLAKKTMRSCITRLQRDLMTIATEFATPVTEEGSPCLGVEQLNGLIALIERARQAAGRSSGFCVPGENRVSACFDIARAVARRLERRAVSAARTGAVKNLVIIAYLNRLSEYLFLLARSLEK